MQLLIIEDEPTLRHSMVAFFADATGAASLKAATQKLATSDYDAIVLDLALPDGDGLTWLADWRAQLPKVLVLTANDQEKTVLAGLSLADDYVIKPVSLPVLRARLRKLVPEGPLPFGHFQVDLDAHRLLKDGVPVTLTAIEWRLIAYMAQHQGQLVAREQLLTAGWDSGDEYVADNTLTVAIKRLRTKLEGDPGQPQLIQTIRGMGYFINGETD